MPHESRAQSKAKSPLSPARRAALNVVRTARERDAFMHDLIDSYLPSTNLTEEDRAFATKLAVGVAIARGTLDECIERALDKPTDIQPEVRDCLRISAYEIFFLGKSAHAAVDQGVELVRSVVPKAAGLANFILRRMAKLKSSFPFGDPAEDDAALARLHAFPLWLARLLIAELGRDEAARFMAVSNEQAPVFLALNAIRVQTPDAAKAQLMQTLTDAGAKETALPGCLYLPDGRLLADARIRRAFAKGELLVSDFAAQRIAALGVQSAREAAGGAQPSVLEIGAGRATKTILLQSGAYREEGRQMRLSALDNHGFKTDILQKRTHAYGVDVEAAITGDGTRLDKAVGDAAYHTVFIDAPCSGLGTLRRHPELRWRLTPDAIGKLAAVQQGMLQSAAEHVMPGGSIVYSTCTVTHVENQANVKAFLQSPAGAAFRLVPVDGHAAFAPLLASGSCDAHFAVRLRREQH